MTQLLESSIPPQTSIVNNEQPDFADLRRAEATFAIEVIRTSQRIHTAKLYAADSGNPPLNPTSDIFVRYLLGAEKNTGLLIHFINAVFDRKGTPRVVELEIRNPFNLASDIDDKESLLDVRARDTKGRILSVEIQVCPQAGFGERSLYYWAHSYAEQLNSGVQYHGLRPANRSTTIANCIL